MMITIYSIRIFFKKLFITSLISAFQQLTIALLLTKGGPLNSTYFFAMYIYDNAFKFHDMGYAAAMSWVMFLIILVGVMIYLLGIQRRMTRYQY